MREISAEIVQKASAGEMSAFEEIYKVYSSIVYTLALGITRNSHDAEEAAQDVFVKIFRSLKDFQYRSSFGTWVYRIAVNTSINMHRSGARKNMTVASIEDVGDLPDVSGIAPDAAAGKGEAVERVNRILENLSPEHRICIMLREIDGLDYQEISDVLGVPLNTVRSRLKRAREAMIEYCRNKEASHEL